LVSLDVRVFRPRAAQPNLRIFLPQGGEAGDMVLMGVGQEDVCKLQPPAFDCRQELIDRAAGVDQGRFFVPDVVQKIGADLEWAAGLAFDPQLTPGMDQNALPAEGVGSQPDECCGKRETDQADSSHVRLRMRNFRPDQKARQASEILDFLK
jgi:hypothetical protein